MQFTFEILWLCLKKKMSAHSKGGVLVVVGLQKAIAQKDELEKHIVFALLPCGVAKNIIPRS